MTAYGTPLMGAGIAGKPFQSLLLHCDGADASTSFPDSGATGHTVTAVGNAQVDTAQFVFGTGSGLFDGTGDYLSIPDHADWALGAGDFTLDLRARFSSLPGAGAFYSLAGQGWGAAGQQSWWATLQRSAGGALRLRFFGSADGTATALDAQLAWEPSTDTWYHIAFTRAGTTFRGFADGVQVGADTTANFTFFDSDQTLRIGADGAAASGMVGWFDEVRIVKGLAAWVSNFTPPTAPYL